MFYSAALGRPYIWTASTFCLQPWCLIEIIGAAVYLRLALNFLPENIDLMYKLYWVYKWSILLLCLLLLDFLIIQSLSSTKGTFCLVPEIVYCTTMSLAPEPNQHLPMLQNRCDELQIFYYVFCLYIICVELWLIWYWIFIFFSDVVLS